MPDLFGRSPLGRRGVLVLGLALLGASAAYRLGLDARGLLPREGGLRIARDFFAAALTPALDYEVARPSGSVPSFLSRLAGALWQTVLYAAAALSLALLPGLVLGCLASSSVWAADPMRMPSAGLRRCTARLVRGLLRLWIGMLRSVHELLWAAVLLAALGVSPATGVLALAIPLSGTLAKVFSELLDEASQKATRGVRSVGAGPLAVFAWGSLPTALPDMAAYTFYRFECALRTSAVLGFFGFPTRGYHLRAAFEVSRYREVWSYLYALILMVLLLELLGAALRRRFLA